MALRVLVYGRVQAVGYRAWAVATAEAAGLDGFVRNRQDGSVEILVRGDGAAVQSFVEACRKGPWGASVSHLEVDDADEEITGHGFHQLPSI